jgi:hypothetical protein
MSNNGIYIEPEFLDSDILVYVVHKQGYKGNGIHAVSASLNIAKIMAQEIANNDIDTYHTYDVYPVPLGRLLSCEQPLGWLNQEPLMSASKRDESAVRKALTPLHNNGVVFFVIYHRTQSNIALRAITSKIDKASKLFFQLTKEAGKGEHHIAVYEIPSEHYPLPIEDYKNDHGWMNSLPLKQIVVKK